VTGGPRFGRLRRELSEMKRQSDAVAMWCAVALVLVFLVSLGIVFIGRPLAAGPDARGCAASEGP
jgi:hypothetical protein